MSEHTTVAQLAEEAIEKAHPVNQESEVSDFRAELEKLINRESMEGTSGTPDFILAEFLTSCLKAWNQSMSKREAWHGRGVGNASNP